jgi:hypothetical protein
VSRIAIRLVGLDLTYRALNRKQTQHRLQGANDPEKESNELQDNTLIQQYARLQQSGVLVGLIVGSLSISCGSVGWNPASSSEAGGMQFEPGARAG